MTLRTVAVVGLALSLAGCLSPDAGPGEGIGTVVGTVAGAAIGSQFGGGSGRVVAAVAGAAIGGLIGNSIGRNLDEANRRRAYEAEYKALEYGPPNAPVYWRSEDTAYYGTVVPGPYQERQGYGRCREFTHTIYIDGRPETARGLACRNPDGTWYPVG